jgi:DNA-binding CsgD family transcriptional regulator
LFPDDLSYNLARLIYESAADPEQWPDFLKALATDCKKQLVRYDVAKNPWTTRKGPFWTAVLAMESGDIPLNREVLAGKFYAEYLRSQDCFSMPELKLLPALMPHVQRAGRLCQQMEALEQRVAALSELINLLPGGVIVAGDGARVLAMNGAAEIMPDGNNGLKNGAAGLSAGKTGESDGLRATIAEAVAGREGALRAAVPMAISRDSAGGRLKVTVAPLPAQTSDQPRLPMAVLFITDADKGPEQDLAFLQRVFSMTAAEARVSAALTQGKSVEEIARAFGVTLGAIRVHLKRVFSKTGTRRQGELISLLMTSGGPLRS